MLNENSIKSFSLTNFDSVIETAAREKYISQESIKPLLAFRDNPDDESWYKNL